MKKLLTAATLSVGLMAGAVSAATIDLGFAIDESGSVNGSPNSGELGLLREGLARAMDRIPSVGAPGNPNTYTVTVVRFASSASTLVSKMVINDANRAAIQNTLRTAPRTSGGTNIAGAVNQLTSAVCGASCTADTTLFNIATDGSGTSPTGGNPSANDNAMAAGVDGISYEAIGGGISPQSIINLDWAYPLVNGEAKLVTMPSELPNPTQQGFVYAVSAFEDFEEAIGAKVGRIIDDTGGGGNVVPLPAAGWLLLGGILGLFGIRRRAA